MMKLGILASHTGTNFQAILDACQSGRLETRIAVVISNNSQSLALQRAKSAGLPSRHLSGATHPNPADLDQAMLATLQEYQVDLVVLAGYMKRLGSQMLSSYAGRIINIHPSLLPKFGGKGMYGSRVHEAVMKSGDTESGVSIHLVDGNYDTGPVIAQTKVPVLANDSAKSLAARVLKSEHSFYVDTLARITSGDISLTDWKIVE
jgi:phosphoribosylglycinamide formyltransferase-1